MSEPATVLPRLTPARLAFVYAAVAGAYIVASGIIVQGVQAHWDTKAYVEVSKGLAFVAVTAVMLYGLAIRLARELNAQQKKLVESERRYHVIFDANPVPSWVYEIATLRFRAVNDAACQAYGFSRDEFRSMTLRDIRPPEDVPALEAVMRGMTGQALDLGTFRHRRRSGEVFPVRISSRSLTFDGCDCRIVVALDISEIMGAREQLLRLNKELQDLNGSLERRVTERTEQLARATAELEWFGEAVGHDLKQPIEHLRHLSSELVVSAGPRLTPAEMESSHRLVGAAARMGALVDDLLEFALSDPEHRLEETLSLVLVVSESLGQLSRESPAAGRVAISEPLYWTRAHRPTLSRVVLGVLRMALAADEVTISARREGETVSLLVECMNPRLGDAERTLLEGQAAPSASEEIPKSTGLAILLRSVARLGGRLAFTSDDGRGTFVLTLKYADPL